jgi:hypothetical protein
MPKDAVDYSNTIIYKIYCKDETINDIYVGHTTNFIQRKYSHKIACNSLQNNVKIYNTIRNNGGWNNWNMVEIAKYNCKDATEARIKEQEHYDELKANLNSIPPYIDKSIFFCSTCDLQCLNSKQYEKHIKCNKHIQCLNKATDSIQIDKYTEGINNQTNNSVVENKQSKKIYFCEFCHFTCYQKCDWDRHIIRPKHVSNQIGNTEKIKKLEKTLSCICGRQLKTNSGLWKHQSKCNRIIKTEEIKIQDNDSKISGIDKDELIISLLKQNNELLEIVKKTLHISNISKSTTISNKGV